MKYLVKLQEHETITRRSVPTLARWNRVRSCPSDHRVSRYWYGHYFWPPRCQRSQKSLCTVHRHGIFVPWKSHTKNLSSICITHCQLLTEIFLHSWCTYELPIDTIRLVLNLMEGFLSIFQQLRYLIMSNKTSVSKTILFQGLISKIPRTPKSSSRCCELIFGNLNKFLYINQNSSLISICYTLISVRLWNFKDGGS